MLTSIIVQGKAGMGKRRGRDAAADWKGSKVVFEEPSEPTNHMCSVRVMVVEEPELQGVIPCALGNCDHARECASEDGLYALCRAVKGCHQAQEESPENCERLDKQVQTTTCQTC